MTLYSEYVEKHTDVMAMLNCTALEALLRAVEDDISIVRYGREDYLDPRALSTIGSMEEIRELIRCDCFVLDLVANENLTDTGIKHMTPYGRHVKKGWHSNHYAISTEKGWLVFDVNVHVQIE